MTAEGASFASQQECIRYVAQGSAPLPQTSASLSAAASNCFVSPAGYACELAITGSGLQPFAQVDYCVDDVVPCGDAPIGPGVDADGTVDHLAVASCPAGRSIWVQSTTASGELIASEPQACPPALPTSLTAVASNCFAFDGGQACELAISGSGLQPFAQVDYCVDDVVPCGDAPIGPGANADGTIDHLAVASCPAGRSIWVQSTTAAGELIVSEPQHCPTL
ncbi:MAG: hypothetical protein Q8K79_01005 [Solirubrobacteraceae bacterium]|nr:hypothetical protein [Solirubrobacteraceae bacterium]